jgi:hypothetical protein
LCFRPPIIYQLLGLNPIFISRGCEMPPEGWDGTGARASASTGGDFRRRDPKVEHDKQWREKAQKGRGGLDGKRHCKPRPGHFADPPIPHIGLGEAPHRARLLVRRVDRPGGPAGSVCRHQRGADHRLWRSAPTGWQTARARSVDCQSIVCCARRRTGSTTCTGNAWLTAGAAAKRGLLRQCGFSRSAVKGISSMMTLT